ncbi:hypothetical protein ACFVP3_38855 [Streptomyces sp. NPDC057806]|uniref:hypothetical protein n=1 Tax=Streptomyces sp. NPDC057806 TaxID=3346255 RepID=UPI0036915896
MFQIVQPDAVVAAGAAAIRHDHQRHPSNTATQALRAPLTPRPQRTEDPHEPATEATERFAEAHQAFLSHFQAEPTPHQWATWLRDTYDVSTRTGAPTCEDQAQPLPQAFQARHALNPQQPAPTATATEETVPTGQRDDSRRSAWPTDQQQQGAYPEPAALESHVREQHSTPADGGRPITGNDLAACVAAHQEHEHKHGSRDSDEAGAARHERAAPKPLPKREHEAAPASVGTEAADKQHAKRVNAAINKESPYRSASLTTVDRYYLAWMEYRTQNKRCPQSSTREAEELSAYLASKGLRGRGGKPVSPATLRRYLLPFRIYNIWAEQREHSDVVSLDAVAKECAAQGITAQYNKPLNADYLTDQSTDFERRWQALHHHHAGTPQ